MIVATIGPSSQAPEILTQILPNIDMARMNMSYGTHDEHQNKIDLVRKMDSRVQILVDIQGPKIRIGKFPDGSPSFHAHECTPLIYDPQNLSSCDKNHIYVSVPELVTDVSEGDILVFGDGEMEAIVLEKQDESKLYIEFIRAGKLGQNKGVTAKTASLSTDPITPKDKEDIEFAALNKAEYVALSFVRSASDILVLREMLAAYEHAPKIVAKIERSEALHELDDIVKASDMIMLARGDLALEVGLEHLPRAQNDIVEACKSQDTPCIWATQVLESMTDCPVPTRAEATDIYYAITSGAHYTMLSQESASGDYPIEAVQFMKTMWDLYRSTENMRW